MPGNQVTGMHRTCAPALSLVLCAAASSVWAVNKCSDPVTGKVTYSDGVCTSGAKAQQLYMPSSNVIGPASDRPDHIRAAIAAKRPAVGMTLAELQRALGQPDKINAGQYGSEFKDQLIYYGDQRTLYVYTTNGVVTAIQNTDGGRPAQPTPVYTAPVRSCPSDNEIRNIEFQLSKLENRDRPQVLAELHRQLGVARACRR